MKKCKGGCQMKSGGKTCMKCGCDMEDEEYEKGEKEEKEEMRSGGMACMKCGGKMHKSGGTVSSCMKCGGGKYTFGGKVGWSKKKINNQYASGGMIKRDDGSYSQRGLWDNIRDNVGSGKKPTKQMLDQEKKIKQEMAVGGKVDTGCPPGFVKDFFTGKCVPAATTQDSTDVYNSSINLQNKMSSLGYLPDHNNWTIQEKSYNTSEVSPQELLAEKTYLNPNQKLTAVPLLGTAAYKYKNDKNKRLVEDVGDFYVNKKIDENKYEVSELSSTAGYNTDLPYQLFDRRIAPTSFKGYGYDRSNPLNPKDAIGDSALMLSYDPVKVKIYSERTPEEHIEYQQKYGNYGGAAEPYVPNAITISDPGKPKQEPDYYNMKTIGFSPEDAKIIYELQGLGPIEGSRGSSAYEKDLALKLKMYKAGREFAPIMQQIGGYNNIPRHDFSPTLEDVKRFREEPGYRQQWDKDILMQYYGMKPENFQATNKRKQYSFGGAITGLKKYGPGGEIDNTLITNDPEIQLGKGMFNVPEPQYDANKIMANVFKNAVSLKETEQPTTKESSDYKKIVQSNKVTTDNKALPNWGRAQKEQQILNELIRRDISQGIQTVPLLVEDDIIGDKTLEAMRLYEKSGKYSRPELFKDKWLAEYKKQWEEIQRGKQSSNQQQTHTETNQTQTESVNPDYNPNLNPIPSFNYFSSDWGKLSSDAKANTNTSTSKPKPQGKGWPKQELLKEGGIEIDSKELVPKDFDTYEPIKGISNSTKGVRVTGRDRSKAYFDAVEKGQYFDLNGLKANTSLKLIGDLLSKSKKAIIIPKGQDDYGRDLNDIYLQDENNPNQYHALDSFGVVNREAIFGKYKDSGEENMTDRQKLITKQAKEAGGFKYNMSPWLFREMQNGKDQGYMPINYNINESDISSIKSKSKVAKYSAEDKVGKEGDVTVLRKYYSSGPSYTKIDLVVKDNATNKTHTVTIPEMFDKAKGKYHTIEIAGKKHKIFLDPNLK